MAKCYHDGCKREIEFELTGWNECNYHMGLDFEGDDMHPIRPMSKEPAPPKLTKAEQRLIKRVTELEALVKNLENRLEGIVDWECSDCRTQLKTVIAWENHNCQ